MCSDIAVKTAHLSKSYHIYDTPRDRLWQLLSRGKSIFIASSGRCRMCH